MSRQAQPAPRTMFASKTTFDALAVDAGEDTEEEEERPSDLEQEIEQESSSKQEQEPVKLTKSAIKKAQRLARLEQKQRQKQLRPQPHKQEDVSSGEDPISKLPDEGPVEPSHEGPLPARPPPVVVVLTEPQNPTKISQPEVIQANGITQLGEEPPFPTPIPPLEETPSSIMPDSLSVTKPVTATSTHNLPRGNGSVVIPAASQIQVAEDSEKVKKRQNVLTRTIWTFIMIGGFVALLLLGHAYMILLVLLCQTLVYREVTALFSLRTATSESQHVEPLKGKDPWSKTLNWYFFAVTNYFLYGESIIYYFKHVVFADANLLPFATNHRMISFTLYIIGFMGFVMSLKKGYLKQQFGLFCWVHMSLLLIVVSSHFIVNNILEGLIWFWVPASLVICNDIFAYIWGVTVGRTPLISLSPKKTVEGFVGAFISTMIFSVVWGAYFMRFDYMICPVQDLGVSAWSSIHCTPNPVFVWKTLNLWPPVSSFLTSVTGHGVKTIPYAPYQLHLLTLACFASLVAPFGGFFASGFKRAFNIKDFGHSIPGHGGMTDRMDCQFLMGIFTYVYYTSLIRVNQVTVGGVMQTIVSGLTVEQQLQLIGDLRKYLEGQGITVS